MKAVMLKIYLFLFFAMLYSLNMNAQQKLSPTEKRIQELYDKKEYVEAYNIAIDDFLLT